MNRIAILALAASLSFAACAHDDTNSAPPRAPVGATELQTTPGAQEPGDSTAGTTPSTTPQSERARRGQLPDTAHYEGAGAGQSAVDRASSQRRSAMTLRREADGDDGH